MRLYPFIPYPPIERHGVVGDRRTAALVAADGTLDWLCLPDYDGAPVFGALLDAERGGGWRLGPAAAPGEQRYLDDSAALLTTWRTPGGELELTDAMAWPGDDRPRGDEGRRVALRRLRCTRGRADGLPTIRPRDDFDRPAAIAAAPGGLALTVGGTLGLRRGRG